MANYLANENLGGGYAAGGRAGRVIEKHRHRSGDHSRKTVTFGDASAITGNRLIRFGVIVGLIAIWAASAPLGIADPEFFPGPAATMRAGLDLATDGFQRVTLFEHLGASMLRMGAALIIGLVVGVPLGLAMGLSNTLRAIVDPILELLRPIPPLAFVPLLIAWFGVGERPVILMLAWPAVFILAIATRTGLARMGPTKVWAAHSLGASRREIVRHVLLPAATPEIFIGLRIVLGVNWTTLVAAELIGTPTGLGAMIWTGRTFFRNDIVLFGIITIGVVGVLIEVALRQAEQRLVPWRGRG